MENPYQTPQATDQPVSASYKDLTIKEMLFSMDGRIPRNKWWLYSILTNIFFNIISTIVTVATISSTGEPSTIGLILTLLMTIPAIWIGICIHAKRLHDCDKSGWYMLIPIYGFILTGFIKGTPGQNKYGANPLGE